MVSYGMQGAMYGVGTRTRTRAHARAHARTRTRAQTPYTATSMPHRTIAHQDNLYAHVPAHSNLAIIARLHRQSRWLTDVQHQND